MDLAGDESGCCTHTTDGAFDGRTEIQAAPRNNAQTSCNRLGGGEVGDAEGEQAAAADVGGDDDDDDDDEGSVEPSRG